MFERAAFMLGSQFEAFPRVRGSYSLVVNNICWHRPARDPAVWCELPLVAGCWPRQTILLRFFSSMHGCFRSVRPSFVPHSFGSAVQAPDASLGGRCLGIVLAVSRTALSHFFLLHLFLSSHCMLLWSLLQKHLMTVRLRANTAFGMGHIFFMKRQCY